MVSSPGLKDRVAAAYDRPSRRLEVKASGMDDGRQLTIGEVARKSGLATSAIRYYEQIGLLDEPAREHGHRRYGEETVATLRFVQAAKQAGFTLSEIDELLGGAARDGGLHRAMRALAARKLPEVRALIRRAEAMQAWLSAATRCSCATPQECTLVPAGGEAGDLAAVLEVFQVAGSGCRRPAGTRPHRQSVENH
jgi:MerR family transcriptional regulator, redox-sensitive transcriptional activator SoxR